MHRRARGDEDAGVDEGDVDRQLERRRRPRRPVDDAHEEVRGEERAEEHDLRPDEQEHPERARRDARRVVRRRRAVVVVMLGVRRARAIYAVTASGTSTSTWSTGSFVSAAQPLDEIAAHPAGALAGERRDDHLVDPLVLDRLHHGGVRVGMRDLAVDVEPLGAEERHGAQQPVLRLVVASLGLALRRDDQEARRALRRPLADLRQQRLAEHRLVGDDEDVRLAVLRRQVDDDVLERDRAGHAVHLVDRVAAQPAGLLLRVRRDDDLVRLELGDRVPERRRRDPPRRRPRSRARPPCAAGRASGRAAAAPQRAACRSRRRSPGAAG